MKTNFTSYFRLTMFFVLLFGGVCQVWGADFSISFTWTEKDDNGTYIDNNYEVVTTSTQKAPKDGNFYYTAKAEEVVKNNAGFKEGNFTSTSGATKFRTKELYSFKKGTYSVDVWFHGRDNSALATPDLYIGNTKHKSRSAASVSNLNYGDKTKVTYEIEVASAGDYYFKGEFTSGNQNVGWEKADFTLQAPSTYTVTLNPNGGTIVDATGWTLDDGKYKKTDITSGAEVTLPTFTKSGYSFTNWTNNSGGATVTSPVTVTSDLTLNANWAEITTKKVYLDLNSFASWENDGAVFVVWDGSNDCNMSKVTSCNNGNTHLYSTDVNKNATSLYFKRYKSDKSTKWNEVSTTTSSSDSNNKMKVTGWDAGTWEAFTIPTQSITYQSGTGSDEAEVVKNVTCGDDHTVIANPFTAKSISYAFTGWKESSTDYTPGDVISNVTANHTLVAQWSYTPAYVITVESSDDKKGTTTGSGTYLQGSVVEIEANPTSGNEFVKWNDNNTDNPREITVSGTVTYTATFAKKSQDCTNSLTIQAESDERIEPIGGTGKPSKLEFANDYYTSWTGTGYMDFKGTDGELYYPMKTSKTANLTFTVYYCNGQNTYLNVYKKGAGSDISYGGQNYGKVQNYGGWTNWDKSFSGQVTSTVNFAAGEYILGIYGKQWVAFDKIEVSASTDAFCTDLPTTDTWSVYGNFDGTWKDYEMTDGAVTIPNLGRATGYQFKLRKTSDEGETYTYYGATSESNNYNTSGTAWTLDGAFNVNLTTGAAGSYTFAASNLDQEYPQIVVTYPTAYTITFNDNGADGGTAMTNITNIASGGEETLPAMTRTKSGHRFTGWKDGSDNSYADGATISNITSNITLTAQWETKVTALTIHMANDTHKDLSIGETNQFYVTYTPSDAVYGKELRTTDPWVSDDASIATVSNSGLVTAVKAGTTKIRAYTIDNVAAEYSLTVKAPDCQAFYIHYWNSSSSSMGDWCMDKYGSNEWRTGQVRLPSSGNNEMLSIGNAAGQVSKCENWSFNRVPMAGQQSSSCTWKEGDNDRQYYAGQDALGYFRLFDNSTETNYYLAFEPIYVAMYGLDGSGFTQVEFTATSTSHTYQSTLCKMPNGYSSNGNYKYYVGTKRDASSSQTPFIYNGKSSTDALNGVTGLSGQNWDGKYGKFEMYDNNCNANFGCQFKRYFTYELRNDDESIFYVAPGVSVDAGDKSTTFYSGVPEKTGYTCIGWNTQKGQTTSQISGGSAYTYYDGCDIRYPVWQAKTYTITLDKNTGTSDGEATATFDSNTLTTITHAGNPTGYSLNGYYTTADGDVKVINADGTLVASVEGYTDAEGKWVKDDDCNLFAHWTANQHTLAWEFVGGSATSEDYTHAGSVAYGTALVAPTLTKTGYTFNVWTPVVAATMPDNDVTYTASWNVRTYNITYHNIESSEHNNPATYTIESDITLANPTATRTGYTFGGWYLDEGLTNPITRIYQMHEDKNIYAKWNPNQHTLTWETDGDALTGDYTHGSVAYGTTIVAPNTPTKSGFAFVAWTPEVPATMPDNDVTLTATWRVDYCKPYIQLNCKDYDANKVTVNWDADNKATITAHETYAEITNGGAIYLPVALKAGTYNIKVSGRNDKDNDVWLNYFTETSSNSNVTYDGAYYSKTSYNNAGRFGDAFEEKSWDGITVSDGNFLFSITGHTDAEYQWIRIYKANGEPFCPEMYKVNFTQPSQGSTSAQVVGGSTLTTGDEVPEGSEVIFTWAEATGYDFVNFSDGTKTYTQNPCTLTVNSNITITTNIEEEVAKHTLTASVATGQTSWGSVSPTSQQVGEGREASVTAHAETNYRLKEWSSDDIELTAQQKTANPLVFTMPTKDVSVTASFCYDSVHNIIATGTSANIDNDRLGGGGTITKSAVDDASFTHTVLQYDYNISSGDYTGYALPKDDGYKVNSKATGIAFWYKTSSNFIYMEVKANGTESAFGLSNTNGNWKYVYVANANAGSATDFQVWMNHDGKGAYSGQSMSSNTGTVWISEVQATNITSMPDKTVKVNLTVTNDGHGETSSVPAVTTDLATGTQVVLTATADDDYRFKNWTVGGSEVSTNNPYTYTVNATTTIQANFEQLYTLTINTDTHIPSTTGAGSYAAGESVTVEATADPGYIFFNWTTEDGQTELSTENPYTFTMPANDYTIKANSKVHEVYYDITLGKSDNGSVAITVDGKPHDGKQILANTDVVLTATGNEGYGFSQWQDGNKENPRTIKANAENAAIKWTATFGQLHTVTTSYGKPGSSVTGGGDYGTGAKVTLEAFVSDKEYDYTYHFSKWVIVDGSAPITGHETENPLEFNMPANDVSIKALYSPVECVDTFVIQCEDDNFYISPVSYEATQGTFPKPIPNSGGCGKYNDHYYDAHGQYAIDQSGVKRYYYYDYKEAADCQMYYMAELPGASTYTFEVWTAGDADKHLTMNLYQPSEENVVLTYKGVHYANTASTPITFRNDHFQINGTISGITITEKQNVLVGLYAQNSYGAFDQIKITATDKVFCHELSTDTCIIKAGEEKEIPVCGVRHLIMYEGGKANNEENADISNSVLYIRNVDNIDEWEDFALPYTADELKVWDAEDKQEYAIKPVVRKGDGTNKKGHFYLQELLDEKVTAINEEFRQRWANTDEEKPQANKPYIIKFSSAQSSGYFAGRPIYYRRGGSISLPCKDNAVVEEGGWPEKGKPAYYYYANNSLVDISPYDAYVLNDDHTEFVLTEHPIIHPFHCYIQASEETKLLSPRLMLVDKGGSTPTLIPVVEALNKDAEGVFKFVMDDQVFILRNGVLYNSIGQPIK